MSGRKNRSKVKPADVVDSAGTADELIEVNRALRAEIMRRIAMEKNLIESRRFVQRITDATPNLLYLYDAVEDRNIYMNRRVTELLGYTPQEVSAMGSSFFRNVIHPDDLPGFNSLRQRFTDSKDGEIIESEYRMKNSAGDWRWFHCRDVIFKRTSDGLLKLILGIAQDITERKKTEDELTSSREQLRNLLAHQQSVREEERARISREIHDELGQSLTALKMDMTWLSKRLSMQNRPLLEKALLMTKLIDMNIQTVKRISAELRPGLLDDLGLTAALEWQVEEFESTTGIKCSISVAPEDITLERDLSTAIFRIFQETLTNILRHSKAKSVVVRLRKKRNEVLLSVRDNGIGITKKQMASATSIGLMGMKERAGYLGGRVEIKGVHKKGTTVNVVLPIASPGN